MKKKLSLCGLFVAFCLSLNAITVEERIEIPHIQLSDKITSICYSQNFGFEFTKPSNNIIYSGTARVDFQDYWFDLKVGLANQFQYGGLYGKTTIDNKTGKSSTSSLADTNFTQELAYGVGVAFDYPLKEFVNLNFELGPKFGFIISVDKNDEMIGNFLFGIWGSAAARFFPKKDYNLICGIDIGYNFLNASMNTKTNSDSLGCNYLSIRPFVGFCIKSDSFFKEVNKEKY